MGHVTPKAVFDLYAGFCREDQIEVLKLIGSISTAEAPFLLVSELSIPERFRYSQLAMQSIATEYFPIVLREARSLARSMPSVSDEDFDKALDERVKDLIASQANRIAELEREQLKEQRDRKPDVVRLERGKLILEANRSGVAWKRMTKHILEKYPDWFPEFSQKSLNGEEKKRLEERLRKMARDAKAS